MARIIGGRLASIAFTMGASNSSSPFNNFQVSDATLGAESPKRQMLAIVRAQNANVVSDTNFTTAVTIAGVTATRIYQPGAAAFRHFTAWMTDRTEDGGPSGATGNLVVSRSIGNGFNTLGVALFALYDLRDPTLAAFDAVEGNGNPTALIGLDLPGGGLIAAMAHAIDTAAIDWTGASEVYDATGGVGASQRFSAALASKMSAANGHTITAGNGATAVDLLGLSFK